MTINTHENVLSTCVIFPRNGTRVIQLGGIPEKPLNLTFDQISSIPDESPLNCADADAQAGSH